MRVALGVEYDGSAFFGWQSQVDVRCVQDVLEDAIKSIAGHEVRIHAAGRTDTGVHALSQVVHFDTHANRPETAWVRGVNAFLPQDVRICWSKVVDEDFHARFSAKSRSYQYWLINAPVAPAILARHASWYHAPLDVCVMREGCQYLLGEHDFSAFRASECQAKTPVKTIHEATIQGDGVNIIFNFSASAFLHHQVRNMVGALIYVGNGKETPELIKNLLNHKDRTLAPPTFSPNGLYLTGVGYDKKWQLPDTQRSLNLPRW